MANIDRADWHYGGDFPEGLPHENGGTHIGVYLAWVILNDQASDELRDLAGEDLELCKSRKITGRTLLFKNLDEKFWGRLLTDECQAFTDTYYETNQYFDDYAHALGLDGNTLYTAADSWENYDKVARLVTERFVAWRDKQGGA